MTKRVRGWVVLLLMFTVLAVGPAVLTTQAGDVSLGGAHWARQRNPLVLRVGDNTTGKWSRILDRSADQWSESRVVNLRVVASRGESRRTCKARNGRVEVCNARYGKNGWLGLSRIWVDNQNHIVRASIMINDTYFDDAYYNSGKARRHTMCHELGHVLGLDHRNGRTCLNDSDASVFRDIRPSRADLDRLERLYRHRDRASQMQAAGAEGGRVIEIEEAPLPSDRTFSTSTSVHSESLGGGARLVTFITWVKDAK